MARIAAVRIGMFTPLFCVPVRRPAALSGFVLEQKSAVIAEARRAFPASVAITSNSSIFERHWGSGRSGVLASFGCGKSGAEQLSVTTKILKSLLISTSFGILAAGGALAQGQPAKAENRQGLPASYRGPASAVAAIVNDTVITTYDVEQRLKLMIISSGGRINPQALPQLQSQAVRDLVEEQLKLQEAKKFELEAPEGDIQAELRGMAGQSNLTVDQLESVLKSDGISIQALKSQIAAGIVWPELVQGRYGKRARVTDDEINQTLERLRADATQEQMLVSEICIPVPSPDQAQEYYQGGLQLIEQMRKGVPFAVVAQQFSACTSAAAGGDMGWVRAGELPPEIDEAVRELPPGAVTNPILAEGAFMIMAVRDKRAAVQQGEKSWTLAYAGAPLSMGRAAARTALEKLATAEACAGGRNLRADLGPEVGVAMIENAPLSAIDERFRSAVDGLGRGDLSDPIEADDALHILYACEVDEGLGIPSRDAIEDRLYGRHLQRIANQYLRDVERKSTVDIRLEAPGPQRQAAQPPNG
jgi:peptidyl-prolyl cis-trans isomerase SurA